MTAPIEVDGEQIATFADALLRYASDGVNISLRAFHEGEPQPLRIIAAKINGAGVQGIIPDAIRMATLAATNAAPAVFCPPIAGFRNEAEPWRAAERDLVEAYALSVECDTGPAAAKQTLERLLGSATVVVQSGGEWLNPATEAFEPKLHLHWRLSEPATGDDLQRLKQARRDATTLVGGDASNVPAVHPIRWPGSVHRKREPRLADIITLNAGAEIELGEAAELLARQPYAEQIRHLAGELEASSSAGETDYKALVEAVLRGDDYHGSLVRLAAKLVGSGVSGGAAVNMLRGFMNAGAAPRDERWQTRYDDIPRTVHTAQDKYTPHQPLNGTEAATDLASFEPTGFSGVVPPPRPWSYGNFLMEGAVTGIAAPPGVGKTTFSFQIAIAFALDSPFGPWLPRPGGGGKVWLYNGEEPKDELDRRFIAACMEMGVEEPDAACRLDYNSGLTKRLNLGSQDDRGRFLPSSDVEHVKEIIRRNGYKLFIIDPLIEFHSVKENDIEAFGRVGAVCREIANDCGCAVLAFHHTPKSANGDTAAGDMNAMRGGGPLIGVARFVHTMFGMTAKDADALGISAKDRPSFVRFDDAKANMTAVVGGAVWWRKLGVTIGNAAGVRPADNIGILRIANLEPPACSTAQAERGRVAAVEQELTTLAQEVVRVCVANGHTSSERPTALTTLCGALDKDIIRMGRTKARELVLGRMAEGYEAGGYRIVVSHTHRGKLNLQHIHIEHLEGADAAS